MNTLQQTITARKLARNKEILEQRTITFNQRHGPRVGDFCIHPDGRLDRITHIWDLSDLPEYDDDSIQTGGAGGSYYFGDGYCSYSGGLNPGIPAKRFEQLNNTKKGFVWFFSEDHHHAHNGVHYYVDFRIFRINPPTP